MRIPTPAHALVDNPRPDHALDGGSGHDESDDYDFGPPDTPPFWLLTATGRSSTPARCQQLVSSPRAEGPHVEAVSCRADGRRESATALCHAPVQRGVIRQSERVALGADR